jgi:hypothetical protein
VIGAEEECYSPKEYSTILASSFKIKYVIDVSKKKDVKKPCYIVNRAHREHVRLAKNNYIELEIDFQ